MKMNCSTLILEKLEYRGIKPSLSEYAISWIDFMERENTIQVGNADCAPGKLAWFQSNQADEYLLQIYDGQENFQWKPITYNPYFGCSCHLLEWYEDCLVFIYSEKHETYICSIKNKQVNTFSFDDHRLARQNEILLFGEDYAMNTIRRIRVPDLLELEPISRQEAEQQGLLPQVPFGINPLHSNNRRGF